MGETANVKQVLTNTGHYKGPIDDTWTPQLSDALAAFQGGNGLTQTGVFDLATKGLFGNILRLASGTGLPYTAADQQEALKRYGPGFAAYIDHPEIGPIIIDGAKTGKDQNWLIGQLQKTAYWKTTATAARTWEEKKLTEPATAQQQLNQKKTEINDLANNLGLPQLGAGDLDKLSNDAIAFEWTPQMLSDMLAGYFNQPGMYAGGEPVGDVGAFMGDIKKGAARQLLTVSDQTSFDLALKMVRGETTLDAIDVMFRAQAKAKVPHLAELIDNGIALSDIFEPHRQRIAQTLEIGADAVDFINDPTWSQVPSYADPSTGKVRMMTENEAATIARKQGGWKTTNNANQQSTSLLDEMSKTWGVRA